MSERRAVLPLLLLVPAFSVTAPAGGGDCLLPPARALRDIRAPGNAMELGFPAYRAGEVVEVTIALYDLRPTTAACDPPSAIFIEEVLPSGWIATAISDDGLFDAVLGAAIWSIEIPDLVEGKKVSYEITVPGDAGDRAEFEGSFLEDFPGAEPLPIEGEGVAISRRDDGGPLDDCGNIRSWNILGAYDSPGGPAPGEEVMRKDYMTDGATTEADFAWSPGATIATDFGGAAASTRIDGGAAGRNPAGVPEVFPWMDSDGRIDLNEAFGGMGMNCMAYAQVYLAVAEDREVFLGASSDDSIGILLNGEDVWTRSIPRALGDPCAPWDIIGPLILPAGESSLIVKVFQGGGGWEFAVRFQDASGNPMTAGIEVRLISGGLPPVPDFRRGDADGDGRMDLADPIAVLTFLFLGGTPPDCAEAADADDDGVLGITDAIRCLKYLFLGVPPPGRPGPPPGPCGPDPPGSPDIGCASYSSC